MTTAEPTRADDLLRFLGSERSGEINEAEGARDVTNALDRRLTVALDRANPDTRARDAIRACSWRTAGTRRAKETAATASPTLSLAR